MIAPRPAVPPPPPVVPGYRYLGKPGCATNDIAGHPSAYLTADRTSANLVCCESVPGANTAAGGPGQRAFSPDCMQYCAASVTSCLVTLIQPGGCYQRI